METNHSSKRTTIGRRDFLRIGAAGSLSIALLGHPARGGAVLLVRGAGAGQAEVELFDLAGRLVRQWPGDRSGAVTDERRLEAPSLPPGVYLARARRNQQSTMRRIVILP